MSPSRIQRSTHTSAAPWREIRRMSRTLNRILDAASHVTIVFLALYVGAATFGLGA